MSWIVILAFALLVFFLFVFLLSRFVSYMKKEQNLQVEPFKETLIDKDNPIGLSPTELDKLKRQQQEAQAHLREVIAKLPVTQKEGRFVLDEEEIRRRKEASQPSSQQPSSNGK